MRALFKTLVLVGATRSARAGDLLDVVDATAVFRAHRVAEAPPVPRSAYERAARGEVVAGVVAVEGVAAGKGWGVALVSAPIEAVWMGLNDESRQAGRMPVATSAVIGGAPFAAPRQVFEFLPLPIVSDRWWVVDVAHNARLYAASGHRLWEMSWTDAADRDALAARSPYAALAAAGTPVAWTRGAWLLQDAGDGRTLVEYYAWSDPGGSVPAGLASRFAGGAIRDALTAAAALGVESVHLSRAGHQRPDGTPL